MNTTKTLRSILLLILLWLAATPALFGQGTAFTYQGRLNSGGSPASGSYDLRFKLFFDAAGNSQVGGTVLTNAVAVNSGLFTVTVDFGAGIFNGSNYWLLVGVRTNGTLNYNDLSPLQPVTPAPYAIMANSASNLLGSLASVNLSGTYGSTVTLNNAGNQLTGSFTGNGGNVTNVNAVALNGLKATNFWQLGGNNVAAGQFLGSTNNQPVEFWVNGQRALRLEATSAGPNVIGGFSNNFATPGVTTATIAGGGQGGATNRVNSSGGTVGGGNNNSVSNFNGTISGGANNFVAGNAANVGGGSENTAAGDHAAIGGGQGNQILANTDHATIAGGSGNRIASNVGTVGGGVNNSISNVNATVSGGANNIASGNASSIGGGSENFVSSDQAAIGGGQNNQIAALSDHATISGGSGNSVAGFMSTISGGESNQILSAADHAIIGGGGNNVIGGAPVLLVYSTIGGGQSNNILTNAIFATISGGLNNTNSGVMATVPGGDQNVATNNALAAGHRAKAVHTGAFVWADSQDTDFSSTVTNQFNVRANGGVRVVTGGAGMTLDGQSVLAGSGPGTVADGLLSANVDLLNANQTFTGAKTFQNTVQVQTDLFMDDHDIRMRNDFNHGLGYRALDSFGVNQDGPLLYGFAGGALGYSGPETTVLKWSFPDLVTIYSNLTVTGSTTTGNLLVSAAGNPSSAALNVQGNGTNNFADFGNSVGIFQNTNNGTNNSPALRVQANGSAPEGALSVSTQGGGLIAQFGNGSAFVSQLDVNGNWTANSFTGNGGGLSNLSAAQVSGTFSNALVLPALSSTPDKITAGVNGSMLIFEDGNQNGFGGGGGDAAKAPTGSDNTGFGAGALGGLTTIGLSGSDNTALGAGSLNGNTKGNDNTAVGFNALVGGQANFKNTVIGSGALGSLFDGVLNPSVTNNIVLGYLAGSGFSGGESSNIVIGNVGTSGDQNTIRIGTTGIQTSTFIAGVIHGDGSGLTSLPASAALLGASQTFTGSNTFTNTMTVTNSSAVNSLNVFGARTGGWQTPVALIENKGGFASNSPALRLQTDGVANDGGLSVSVNVASGTPNSIIAEFGNSGAFVTVITNDGTIFCKATVLSSDRNLKEHFTALDEGAVLAKVAALPVTEWNYKEDPADKKHIGPMAQDFYAAFGLDGADDKHISTVDEGGVALAAIQGLNQKLDERLKSKDAEIEELKRQNDLLARRLNELEAAVHTLARRE